MKPVVLLSIGGLLALMGGMPVNGQVNNPLLTFCTQPRPEDSALAEFYDSQCPSVLELAVQTATQSMAAAAASTEAQNREKEIANLKSLFPASTPAENKPSVDIAPLAHIAQFRQYQLLAEIGTDIRAAIIASGGDPSITILSGSELDSLRRIVLLPSQLQTEFGNISSRITSIEQSCSAKPDGKPTGPRVRGLGMSSALIVADSLLGLSLKVSQAFQTTLTGAASGDLTSKADATAVIAHSIASAWPVSERVSVGWPSITKDNAVLKAATDLQESSWDLLEAMSKVDAKHPCVAPGKAILEAMHARMTDLNTPGDAATPSPLLLALRAAELDVLAGSDNPRPVRLLAIDPVHTGGSVIATKSAFTSQRYMRLATVAVAYRLETPTGRVVAAGLATRPNVQGAVDRQQLGKHLESLETN